MSTIMLFIFPSRLGTNKRPCLFLFEHPDRPASARVLLFRDFDARHRTSRALSGTFGPWVDGYDGPNASLVCSPRPRTITTHVDSAFANECRDGFAFAIHHERRTQSAAAPAYDTKESKILVCSLLLEGTHPFHSYPVPLVIPDVLAGVQVSLYLRFP
ncbi:hypothetical protein F5148DRAFT_712565 [Russula earlei]|uniref:Uncharacterized protein n=1 Tax=Russula earlei TaxID=71964 RepID=A0ACC0TV67_9AGAM|nr:hypothetical protein F5148DRAFT_712565 [Russula earlei]